MGENQVESKTRKTASAVISVGKGCLGFLTLRAEQVASQHPMVRECHDPLRVRRGEALGSEPKRTCRWEALPSAALRRGMR